MKTEADREMEELREKPNKIFKFVRFMKRDGKDVEGGKWIKGRNGKIGFNQEDRCKIWKEHMERIMNEENAWDHKVDAAMAEGPVEKVFRKEVGEAIREMKRKGCGVLLSNNGDDCCRWQNCWESNVTALPTSFGWKGNPGWMENQRCGANF